MAVDVKSRAKRYEKLDFLGEGQVRPWADWGPRWHSLATAGSLSGRVVRLVPPRSLLGLPSASPLRIRGLKRGGVGGRTNHHVKTSHCLPF